MKYILITLAILSTLASSSLNAFDDEKEGFFISLGAGIHTIETSMSASGVENKVNENGIATSFNIGYGFSDDFMLYYSNNINWYNKDDGLDTETFVNGISGIGITYYVDSEVYLNFVYGIATDYPYVDRWMSLDGTGYEIGIGYDIAKHVSVELDYSHSDYNEATLGGTSINFDGFTATAHSLRMMIKYNWY